jgi:hypothetical protein
MSVNQRPQTTNVMQPLFPYSKPSLNQSRRTRSIGSTILDDAEQQLGVICTDLESRKNSYQ